MTESAGFNPPATLAEQIAQLMFVRIGSNLPPIKTVDQDEVRVRELLDDCPIGGLVLFNGVWPSTARALARLQAQSAIPLLVGSDIERGCGQQMHGLAVFPHAMAFGQLADAEQAAREFGQLTARQARLCGIHIAFAPVADTNTNRDNPIIATRAFGTDPEHVARLAAAFVRGCESAGLATTAKHFPGHGDTRQDSHDALPVVARPRESLLTTEIPPFASAIEAGCSLVMTAHVAYPALDNSGTPATLSASILGPLLRDRLGFSGVVCSDSLLMAGVRARFDSEGELCLTALRAGVDVLLDVEQPRAAVEYLVRAVERGELERERIDQALRRVLHLKRRCFTDPATDGSLASVQALNEQAAALSRRIAQSAVRLWANTTVPRLARDRPLTVLLAKSFATPLDPPEQPLAGALRQRFERVEFYELGPDAQADNVDAARQAALSSAQLVLAMIVKPAAWHDFGLLNYQSELYRELSVRPGTILVSLGVPAILDQFPQAATSVCSFSDVAVSQGAVADFLAGKSRPQA